MRKVGFIVNLDTLLVGLLVGLVLKVDIAVLVKKKGQLQVLDCNWLLEGIFVFHAPVYCCYIMELYPSYPMITILISSQLHTYGGKCWMPCISVGASCGFPGRFSSEGWSCWGSGEKRATSGFWLKVMLGGSLCVSDTCTFNLSCGYISKLSWDHSA